MGAADIDCALVVSALDADPVDVRQRSRHAVLEVEQTVLKLADLVVDSLHFDGNEADLAAVLGDIAAVDCQHLRDVFDMLEPTLDSERIAPDVRHLAEDVVARIEAETTGIDDAHC